MTATRSAAAVLRTLVGAYRPVLWAAMIAAVVAASLGLAIDFRGEPLEQSVWEHAGTPARWVLFVVGLMITAAALPTYVAHGVTRRAFTLAAAAGGALLAVLVALYLAAGYLAERAILTANDRPYELAGEHLFAGVGQVPLVVAEYAAAGLGYLLSGWLVGAAYYRFGALRGTLAAPVGLLPAALMDNALGVGKWLGFGPPTLGWATHELSLVGTLGLALAVLAAGLAAVQALTRTIPLHPRRP